MTRKTNKNTIHVPIWSTQIIMKSFWIVCILNNWGNDSKVSIYELEANTWTQYVQQLVRRNLTVMAGACRVIHPGAPPKPSPGPMSVRTSLLEPHERAAERSVEAVRVLASRQLTAVWAWWDVRSRPAQGNGDRPRLSFRVFHQSLWDCAGRLRRTSLVVLAACKDLTDGFVCMCVCVWGMWYRQETEACSCYTDVTRKGRQPRKDAFYCFMLSADASFITAGHKAELPVGLWSVR